MKLIVKLVRDQVGGSRVEIKQVTVLATQSLNQQKNRLPSCPLTSACPSIHTQTNIIKARMAVGSLSTMWGPEIELGLLGLVASAFTP